MKKIIALVILAIVAAGIFQPHGAEACAEYAWVCYGGLHRRRRLLSGIESVEEVLLVTVQLLHEANWKVS